MLCGNYILSNRSEWTFYFLSSVQFNFTIGDQKIINKNPNTRYLYEIKTENNKLVNYLLSNYRNLPVVDNLQDVLDLDKIKITNSTYEDITDKNIIETIDEQTSKFNWIKKNLIKEMKATKNDKQ